MSIFKKSSKDPLILITSPRDRIRVKAIKTLIANPNDKTNEIIKECLKDKSDIVKFLAFDFLSENNPDIINEIEDKNVLKETILKMLKITKRYEYGARAAKLCTKLNILEAYPIYKKVLEGLKSLDSDDDYEVEFLKSAIEIGDNSIEAELVELLIQNPKIKNVILNAFETKIKSENAIKLLSKYIDLKATTASDNFNIGVSGLIVNEIKTKLKRQVNCAMGIGCIGGNLAFNILMDGIDRKKDRSIYTKRACILGLAKLKNSQSTEVLIDYLSDHDSILQTFALIALISIGDSITDNLINNYNESNKVLSENIIIILANFKNEKAKIFIEKIKEEQKFLTAFEKINNLSLDDIDIERMFK